MRTNALIALVTLSGISGVGCGTNPSAGPLAETSTGTNSGTNTAVSTSTETAKTETAANTETKTASEEKEKKPEAKKEDEKKPSKPTLALDQTKLTFADVVRSIGSDEKTLKFTSDLDIPDLNITVTSGSAATNTSAGPFLITSSCSSIKKGETCTITIKASGTTIGSSTGALKVGTKSGAELASVDLAVDVTMMGVKKVVSGPRFGTTIIFEDGTAKVWGEIQKNGAYAFPNAEFRSKVRSEILGATDNLDLLQIYVKALPVVLPGNAKVVDMIWLGNGGCALDDRERMVCWGMDRADGTRLLVPEVLATGVKSIGGGSSFNLACYLDSASKAWCVGNTPGGATSLTPWEMAPSYVFDYLTPGSSFLCGKVKGAEKVVCGGRSTFALGGAGASQQQYYQFSELDLTRFDVKGQIRDVKVAFDSVCILSDNLGCAGSNIEVGYSGGMAASYLSNYQPQDKNGVKVKPAKLWSVYGAQGGGYCAQEASGRVLCWGRPNRSSFNDPGVSGMSLIPTEQAYETGRTPSVSGGASVVLIGKFDILATRANFSADNRWGTLGFATITPDDATECLTKLGGCY